MSFEEDEEIVQDFLVEAGEILEQLGEQLVTLEQTPTDDDLLNAVFRGFHTIKGGASFIALTSLVEVCHVAEDVFNQLRQGERAVDATLMDVMLRVLDTLHEMFDAVRGGDQPASADAQLLNDLRALLVVEGEEAAPAAAEPVVEDAAAVTEKDEDISDQEFEELLDALDDEKKTGKTENTKTETTSSPDDITEEEFGALLDDLNAEKKEEVVEKTGAVEDIHEAEFDALLDKLHGNRAPGSVPTSPTPATAAVATAPVTQSVESAAVEVAEKPIETAVATPKPPAAKPAASKPKTPPKEQAETTVRVDTKRLDDIMNMVGELVLVRNRLMTLEAAMGNEEVSQAASNLDLVTADLQMAVMKTRMQPIKKVFGRFPRVVRDLARTLKKEVALELQGEETDLDKNLVEALADPLVHLVRNAVDHGIEMPDVRLAAGKSKTGTVLLSAEQEGDHILLVIQDDGGGMDPDILRGIAVKKGLMDQDAAARLEDKEAFSLIFAPGFSTKDEISDISGRGVGMDVVKTRIVQLNGTVEIESRLGKGTKLSIKVPLTLAIMPTLMVMLEKQIFALPLVSVSEIFNLDLTETNRIDGQEVIMLRDQPLPLYFIKDWLVNGANCKPHPDRGHVVVVTVGNQKAGFVVEQLIGQEEVVIKPLGKMLQGTKGLSGATITGDGEIALILDVPSLMSAYARKSF